MMTTLICGECSEPRVVTSRSTVMPFVCDECQKDAELLAAMAPGAIATNAPVVVSKAALRGPTALKVEESDNDACDAASVENTTLLIEDQANQLALAKNEVEALRQIVQYLEARETALTAQVENRQNQVENLLVKNFFKDEKITKLNLAGFQILAKLYLVERELKYAATRLFNLAAENVQLEHERDMWQKRALFARRQYDRAAADRAYYRGKLKDAGIKA